MSSAANLFENSTSRTTKENNAANLMEKSLISSIDSQIKLSDFTVIKMTPSETDLITSQNRVMAILNETMEKLQIAINLRELLELNACKLRKFLPINEVKYIQNVCVKYLQTYPQPENSRQLVFTQNEKFEVKSSFTDNPEDFLDTEMVNVLELVWGNNKLRSKALTEWCITREPELTALVNAMKKLKKFMNDRFSISALKESKREKYLRSTWHSNKCFQKKIQDKELELEDQRRFLEIELKSKTNEMNRYSHSIEAIKQDYKSKIITKVGASETEMYELTRHHNLQHEELEESSMNATCAYKKLVKQNIKIEKDLRETRFKVETELSNWISKFDADVSERQSTFEKLTECYQNELIEMDALQKMFDEQEIEYNILMAEKLAEEKRIWDEKAYEFLCIRAAKKIQRYWRAYRLRKLFKRKIKKGRKEASAKAKPKSK